MVNVPAKAVGLVDRRDLGVARRGEVIEIDEDGILVEARLGIVGQTGPAGDGEVVGGKEAIEEVGIVRDGQQQAGVRAVEGRDVPAIRSVVVEDVHVAAVALAEEVGEGRVIDDRAVALVPDTDLLVDRLDHLSGADGRVGIRGQAAARIVGRGEVDPREALADGQVAARTEGPQHPVGAGHRLGGSGRVVRLELERGAAGHGQAVLDAGGAGDLDVIRARARSDVVLDILR